MKIPFKTSRVEGDENIMVVGDINPDEIRFNRVTREISIIYEPSLTFTREDIDQLSWQAIKKLVEEHTGEWVNKTAGIEFLIGRQKDV